MRISFLGLTPQTPTVGSQPHLTSASSRRVALAGALALGAFVALPEAAQAQDVAALVAKARDQVEGGNYQDALRTLAALESRELPPAVAVDAALLETTATIVVKSQDAAIAACEKAVVASGYDPEVARDTSPKVRTACREAAKKVRGGRLARERVDVGDLEPEKPEVAWQPIRVKANAKPMPKWLKFVVRVTSKQLADSFDLALVPTSEGELFGTLDASWIHPDDTITVALVAQDKFGDLGGPVKTATIQVPKAEGMIALGSVPSDAFVKVDGNRVTPDDGGRVAVTPGSHEVEMIQGDASASTEVDVARGSVARVALSPAVSSSNALAWIATGTSVACLATGGVLMLVADGRRSDIEEAAAAREPGTDLPATDYATIQGLEEDRETFSTAGTVLLIAGGVTGVLAATLWLWPSGGGGEEEPEAEAAAAARRHPPKPTLGATVRPGWVGVGGQF
jgi:hypothetical protein